MPNKWSLFTFIKRDQYHHVCVIWSGLLSTELCIAVSDKQWSCDHSQIEAVVLSVLAGWQDYVKAYSLVKDLKILTLITVAVASSSVGNWKIMMSFSTKQCVWGVLLLCYCNHLLV